MFTRVTDVKDRKGNRVMYAALAESQRVRGKKHPSTRIIKNIGRLDDKSVSKLKSLCASTQRAISRYENRDRA